MMVPAAPDHCQMILYFNLEEEYECFTQQQQPA